MSIRTVVLLATVALIAACASGTKLRPAKLDPYGCYFDKCRKCCRSANSTPAADIFICEAVECPPRSSR